MHICTSIDATTTGPALPALDGFVARLRAQLEAETARTAQLTRQVVSERVIGTAVGYLMGHLLVPDTGALAVLETRAEARGETLEQVAAYILEHHALPL